MKDVILSPYKTYFTTYKKLHKENTLNYWDKLVEKSGVDVNEIIQTVNKYKMILSLLSALRKKFAKFKFLRTFVIICLLISIIFLLILIFIKTSNILLYFLSVVMCALSSYLIFLLFKKVKGLNNEIHENESLKDDLFKKCHKLMQPLNDLFSWKTPLDIIKKTIPIVSFDAYFTANKHYGLNKNYQFPDIFNLNNSTLDILSGNISKNPFLFLKVFKQDYYYKEYFGSRRIADVVTIRTSDGTVRKEEQNIEILTASVKKKVPCYSTYNKLLYFNNVAGNLSFSRDPSGIKGKSKKEVEKIITDKIKNIENEARKALDRGENYVPLSNTEFEALFGTKNRDNEIEFRYLFTPLAQENLCDLIKNDLPFGDDFTFVKDKKITEITSKHSINFNYFTNPSIFYNFDYEECKKKFLEYNSKYFESLYFDFAPLFSIPEFQLPNQYDNKGFKLDSNLSLYELETIANSLSEDIIKPIDAYTSCINKIQYISKYNNFDFIKINSHSFREVERVDKVRTKSKDGIAYEVDVPWKDYIPVYNVTNVLIGVYGLTSVDIKNLKNNEIYKEIVNNYLNNQEPLFYKGNIIIRVNGDLVNIVVKKIDELINNDIS